MNQCLSVVCLDWHHFDWFVLCLFLLTLVWRPFLAVDIQEDWPNFDFFCLGFLCVCSLSRCWELPVGAVPLAVAGPLVCCGCVFTKCGHISCCVYEIWHVWLGCFSWMLIARATSLPLVRFRPIALLPRMCVLRIEYSEWSEYWVYVLFDLVYSACLLWNLNHCRSENKFYFCTGPLSLAIHPRTWVPWLNKLVNSLGESPIVA